VQENLQSVVALLCIYGIVSGVQAQYDTFPNKVKTRIGELTFDHGVPTEETLEKAA